MTVLAWLRGRLWHTRIAIRAKLLVRRFKSSELVDPATNKSEILNLQSEMYSLLSPNSCDIHHKPSAHNCGFPSQNNIDRFRVSDVFLLQNPQCQCVFIVTLEHRHRFLHDNRSVVEFLIYKVHCAAGHFHPVIEGLL